MQAPLTIAAPTVVGTFSAALDITSLAQNSALTFQVGNAVATDQFSVWGAVVSNATTQAQMQALTGLGEVQGPTPASSGSPVPYPYVYVRRDAGTAARTCSIGGQETPGTSSIYPNQTAANQTAWFIDPVGGNDANNGLTSGTALKTWAQYRKRVGDFPVAASTITLLNNLPASDPMRPPNVPGVAVVITGSQGATTLATVVLTGRTTVNRATNTPTNVTAAGLPANWNAAGPAGSSLINFRARETVGANVGTIFWLAKDTGGKSARASQPITASTATAIVLAGNETVVVEQLVQVGDLIFDQPVSSFGSLVFDSLDFGTGQASPVVPSFSFYGIADAGSNVLFRGCDVGFIDGAFTASGCQFAINTTFFQSDKVIVGCLLRGFAIQNAGNVISGVGTISQQDVAAHESELIGTSASVYAYDIGFFDGPAGLDLTDGGVFTLDTSQGGSLWGQGAATYGVRISTDSSVLFSATPTVTGTSGDVLVGGDAKTWASIATNGYVSASLAKALPDSVTTILGTQPLGPSQFFSIDLTLVNGTKTVASGKDLTNATLLSVRLKTANTAVGSPVATFIAGANGNVTISSFTATGAAANTDASTYTVVFAGAV